MAPALIVGITGASGAIWGLRMLDALAELGVERHLIVSRAAEITLAHETDLKLRDLHARASVVYRHDDIAAAPASGSFPTLGMVIAPCSVSTLSEIAAGITENLLTRAADVTLKERRRLVLMVRETPLHLGHIRAMAAVTEIGAIVAPPVPAFYHRPQSIDDIVDHGVGRVLDLFGLDTGRLKRWGRDVGPRVRSSEPTEET
ncbi:3-octaprenyl-4-hydroxybenzoate carboxy-lyase [uncultured Alphaproteobacteria bacterium]|uniref:Flavin prenyltransferase UbiX n=1 Tax=uncultured Alphaproteobacteria bacterium TaxID=91750 RepID=A0A212JEK6_9PROT|nr:3-octaprenyl-4-hydroxybenzoate carboxy-lyase [uncultured Alphaproteobacteria bacterium]